MEVNSAVKFCAVGAQQHIFLRLEAQALQHVGPFDGGQVLPQHLGHRAAGDIGALAGGALGVQIASGVLGIAHVHVGNMVHDAAVGLLGQTLVEAAVAGLHVEDGDVQPLGRDGGQAAVGVAQDQQRVRLQPDHELIAFGDNVPDRLAEVLAHRVEIVVGRAQAEVFEKDAVQGVVVVLAGVDQDLLEVSIAFLDDGRQTDDLRPGAHDRHQLEFLCHGCFLLRPSQNRCRDGSGRRVRWPTSRSPSRPRPRSRCCGCSRWGCPPPAVCRR